MLILITLLILLSSTSYLELLEIFDFSDQGRGDQQPSSVLAVLAEVPSALRNSTLYHFSL